MPSAAKQASPWCGKIGAGCGEGWAGDPPFPNIIMNLGCPTFRGFRKVGTVNRHSAIR